ncbi:MAG: type III-A CRISPR-associated RAMP protein Csm5 [Bryobacteraceae bacterium]
MKYRVTALTPLLVGDGSTLSPIDYMVWKDQVNVLDQNRIFKLLARGPRLEGYLSQLRKATKLDFASWGGFAQNFSLRRIPFEHSDSTAIWNDTSSESLFIPTFASSNRGPYLPASALKGALRTGLVHARWSQSTIDRLASSLEHDRLPRRASEAAEGSAGASQTKVVSLSDSDPVQPGAFKVYLTRTASLNLQGGKAQLSWKVAGRGSVPPQRMSEATPLFAEMATPGTSFVGAWQERGFLENQETARALGWRSVPSSKMIVDAANDYAEAQIGAQQRYAEEAGLSGIVNTLTRLREELTKARASSLSCLFCLGWGGGFISKSGFLQTEQDSFRKILRTVPALSRGLREGALFPKTRRIVFKGGQPASLAGWVVAQFDA